MKRARGRGYPPWRKASESSSPGPATSTPTSAVGPSTPTSEAGHEHTDLRGRPPRAHRLQGPATSTPTSEAGHEHTDFRGGPRAHRLQGPATSTWRPAGTRTGSRQPERAVAATPVARVVSAPVARFAPRLGDGRAVARRTRARAVPTRWSQSPAPALPGGWCGLPCGRGRTTSARAIPGVSSSG